MQTITVKRSNASVQLGERLHHFDGINHNRTDDDGSGNLRPTGIHAPTTSPTTASGGAGQVDEGVHGIFVTFVYLLGDGALVESNPSPMVQYTAAPGGEKVTLTNIPISDHEKVNARRIYATNAGGNAPVRLTTASAEILDNTTTTFDYNVADANLTDIALSYANEPLPTAAYAISFANRIVCGGAIGKQCTLSFTNGSTAFAQVSGAQLTIGDIGKDVILADGKTSYSVASISEYDQTGTLTVAYQGATSGPSPDSVTLIGDPNLITIGNVVAENCEAYDPEGDSQFDVGQDDGQYLRALATFRQTIVFGKPRSLYQLIGDLVTSSDVPTYQVQLLTNKVGMVSHWSVQNLRGGGLIFYSGDGIYVLDATQPIKISELVDPLFDERKESPILLGNVEDCRVDHTWDEQSHGIYDPTQQCYFVWFARKGVTTLAGYNKPLDLCLMFDFKKRNSRRQPSVWAFLIPASMSMGVEDSYEKRFRILIGTYHGGVKEMFVGYRDGIPIISTGQTNFLFRVSNIIAPNPALFLNTQLVLDATGNYGGYQDVYGGTPGLPIVGASGANKGKFRLLKSFVSTNVVEMDEELYGANPFQIGDIVTIGGFHAFWGSNHQPFGMENMLKRGSRAKVQITFDPFTNQDI